MAAGVASDTEAMMENVDPEKLAKDAEIVEAATEIFGVDMVKVRKWDGPWVPMRVDELLERMRHPKPQAIER